jgi:hypothetical protein
MEFASRKTAKVAAKAAPEPADRAPRKPADTGSAEPTDMATPEPADRASSKAADMTPPKSAARSGDEIAPNPTYVSTSATKAPSEPSTPRRRDVCRRSGQGNRDGTYYDWVHYRTQRTSRHRIVGWRSRSNWRAAERGRSDCRLESAAPDRCPGSLRAWVLTRPAQPPRQPLRQLRDPAARKHESLLFAKATIPPQRGDKVFERIRPIKLEYIILDSAMRVIQLAYVWLVCEFNSKRGIIETFQPLTRQVQI